MSIDHFAYYTAPATFDKEVAFLLASLKDMDIVELQRPMPIVVGLGTKASCKAFLWVAASPPAEGAGEREAEKESGSGKQPVHFALAATDRGQVDAFHKAALEAGGKCNGPPGVRAMYHPGYYAAFVHTPAGMNLEVVCHG